DDYDFWISIVLLGDLGVGKSSLILRIADDTFTSSFISTLGVDFKFRTVNCYNGSKVRLQIWDTDRHVYVRFRLPMRSRLLSAHAVLILYDVQNRKTFENVEEWMKKIRDAAPDSCPTV